MHAAPIRHRTWPDNVALGVLVLAGLAMLLTEPPFIGSDELFHWQRVLQVARGEWLARLLGPNRWGGAIDQHGYDFCLHFFRIYTTGGPLSWSEAWRVAQDLATLPPATLVVPFPSTASFSPLPYLPQAAGVAVARAMGANPWAQLSAGRAANLLCYAAGLAVLRRMLPYGSRTALLTATLPGMLHLATTLSADPLNLLLPAWLAALVLRARLEPPGPGRQAGLVLLCAGLGLLKPTLAVCSVLVLLVPAAALGGHARAWALRAACLLAAFGTALAWNAAYPFNPGEYWASGGDPAATLVHARAHPADMLGTLAHSVAEMSTFWWKDAFGRFGGHRAPYSFVVGLHVVAWVGAAALVAAAVTDPAPRRDLTAAAVLLALALGYALLVVVAFLFGFTPPGAALVAGVQGRYFMPSLLLAGLGAATLRLLPATPPPVRTTLAAAACGLQLAVLLFATWRMAMLWAP